MKIEKRLKEKGINLPSATKPVASYIPYRKSGKLIYLSGQDCRVNGELKFKGKVGKDITDKVC